MKNDDKVNYKLHSSGENWWHFREKLDSIAQSFTITIVHDGTVVMTGDHGVLAFRREFFPKNMEVLKWFPQEGTGIAYFAEKVQQGWGEFKIKDWDEGRAREDIKELFPEDEGYTEGEQAKANDISFYSQESMFDALAADFQGHDMEEFYELGEAYTKHFIFQFRCFKCWVAYLLAEDEKVKESEDRK
jgi:hypothetical protein